MKIKDKKTNKTYDTEQIHEFEEVALELYKEGNHIIYCDLETIIEDDDGTLYLLDECGNYLQLKNERFKKI